MMQNGKNKTVSMARIEMMALQQYDKPMELDLVIQLT
jgi:hypothetical protein